MFSIFCNVCREQDVQYYSLKIIRKSVLRWYLRTPVNTDENRGHHVLKFRKFLWPLVFYSSLRFTPLIFTFLLQKINKLNFGIYKTWAIQIVYVQHLYLILIGVLSSKYIIIFKTLFNNTDSSKQLAPSRFFQI